ncbi:MAG: DUF418 domain-containing protein, partial [Planctomycetota bacterium]|nr:DUF418 domain-containing protein [Planctomycetota bacterium]
MKHSGGAVPTVPSERIALLDGLRGFALLGILFVNMTWFTGFAVLSSEQRIALGTSGVDAVVYWLIHCLIDGKFWSLFALLFGAGAAVQMARSEARSKARGGRFRPFYLRRLTVLLVVGLAHGVLVWFGDIVGIYAVVGFAMLFFVRCSDRAVLAWAAVCMAAPIVQGGIWLVAYQSAGATAVPAIDPGHGPAELLGSFGGGGYWEAFAANWAFLKERWFLAVYEGRFFKLLGMFLIGHWAVRRGLFTEIEQNRRFLIRVVGWGLLIGVPANIVAAGLAEGVPLRPPSLSGWLVGTVRTVGVPALCLAYAAGLSLLFHFRPVAGRAFSLFSFAGRMSLTNYVVQSLVGVGLFYGYGLGYWGRIGAAWSIVLVAVIFGVQIVLSALWLRR